MNLPNKLTTLRVLMIPFFVVFMLTDLGGAASKYIAVGIFIVASLTDLLDGKIAVSYTHLDVYKRQVHDRVLSVQPGLFCGG